MPRVGPLTADFLQEQHARGAQLSPLLARMLAAADERRDAGSASCNAGAPTEAEREVLLGSDTASAGAHGETIDRESASEGNHRPVAMTPEDTLGDQLQRAEARLARLEAEMEQLAAEQAARQAFLLQLDAQQQSLVDELANMGVTVDLDLIRNDRTADLASTTEAIQEMAESLKSFAVHNAGLSAEHIAVVQEQLMAECGICKENAPIRQDPVMTICSHVFCQECLLQWVVGRWSCPKCRKTLTQADIISLDVGEEQAPEGDDFADDCADVVDETERDVHGDGAEEAKRTE